MNHLVSISYPDHIRPLLLSKAAAEAGLPKWHLAKVASSMEYRVRKRKCLFLGLSDGSHTDVFRRSNPQLSNEQVRQSHELTKDRIDDLREDLKKDLKKLLGGKTPRRSACFAQWSCWTIFLLAASATFARRKTGP